MDIYKDGVARVLEYLKDNFKTDPFNELSLQSYYEGDPISIPKANLPCVVVESVGANVTADATGTDLFIQQILIKVILNKQDDAGASDDVDLTERRLRIMVQGRDSTTGQYLPQTILGILRTNLTMSNVDLSNEIAIAYDIDIRPDQIVTSEAHITVTTRERIIVPNRV